MSPSNTAFLVKGRFYMLSGRISFIPSQACMQEKKKERSLQLASQYVIAYPALSALSFVASSQRNYPPITFPWLPIVLEVLRRRTWYRSLRKRVAHHGGVLYWPAHSAHGADILRSSSPAPWLGWFDHALGARRARILSILSRCLRTERTCESVSRRGTERT